MLPRRTSVVKALALVAICLLSLTLFLTNPSNSLWESWELLSVNEQHLKEELREITSELNVTYDANNKTVVQLYRYVKSLKSQLPVNPHKFKYILQPHEVCRGKDVFLLAYVHTAPSHHRRRAAIRHTWGNHRLFTELNYRVIFLMGMPNNSTMQAAIELESDLYGDIVQENFVDSYRNLTYKAIMGLKWISQHCNHAHYVIKADDDIFVNIFNVVNHLNSIEKYENQTQKMILCLVWNHMKVVRDPKSKWYIPRSEFWEDYFPTYCSGSSFVMSGDVIKDLYAASFYTPFFWVDDFYVTGLLAAKVGVQHRRFNAVYTLSPRTFLDKFSEESRWRTLTFGHVHNLDWFNMIWEKVLNDRAVGESSHEKKSPSRMIQNKYITS